MDADKNQILTICIFVLNKKRYNSELVISIFSLSEYRYKLGIIGIQINVKCNLIIKTK